MGPNRLARTLKSGTLQDFVDSDIRDGENPDRTILACVLPSRAFVSLEVWKRAWTSLNI
jgi:hypothetical protein